MYLKYGPKCSTSWEKYKLISLKTVTEMFEKRFKKSPQIFAVTLRKKLLENGGGAKKWFSKLIYTPDFSL